MTFADKVQPRLDELHLTREDLAREVGVSLSTAHRWFSGSEPHPARKWKICNLLQVDSTFLSDITWGKSDPPSSDPIQTSDPYLLTADEKLILSYFRALNEEGKQILLNKSEALVDGGLYKSAAS